jgi:hypothetical protein
MSAVTTQADEPEDATLSHAEVVAAIRSLSAAERTAINKIARAFERKYNKLFDHQDLIQECFTRVLDRNGDRFRRWPRNLPATVFFYGVIKSIASERKYEFLNQGQEAEEIDRATMQAVFRDWVNEEGTARSDKDAASYLEKVLALFDDDPVARRMVEAMINGAKGSELQTLSGLGGTEYESKRKKIRRRIEKMRSD